MRAGSPRGSRAAANGENGTLEKGDRLLDYKDT